MESRTTLIGIGMGLALAVIMALFAPLWVGILVGATLIVATFGVWAIYMIALALQNAENDEDMP